MREFVIYAVEALQLNYGGKCTKNCILNVSTLAGLLHVEYKKDHSESQAHDEQK